MTFKKNILLFLIALLCYWCTYKVLKNESLLNINNSDIFQTLFSTALIVITLNCVITFALKQKERNK